MDLLKENESLKRQLELQANARNQEILDLQHHFADQLRVLQKQKGVDRSAEIFELQQHVSQLEKQLLTKEHENGILKEQVARLQQEVKKKEEENNGLHYSLERARIEAMTAREAKESMNYAELLAPLEEQLEGLTTIITQKQEEIAQLQKLVHKECEERIRLQGLLGMNPMSLKVTDELQS
jgi:Tfp pilus assembly protein FimV